MSAEAAFLFFSALAILALMVALLFNGWRMEDCETRIRVIVMKTLLDTEVLEVTDNRTGERWEENAEELIDDIGNDAIFEAVEECLEEGIAYYEKGRRNWTLRRFDR